MLAFTEILKSHISGIKIDINPIRTWRGGGGGEGLRGPDHEIHSCHSETSCSYNAQTLSLLVFLPFYWLIKKSFSRRIE